MIARKQTSTSRFIAVFVGVALLGFALELTPWADEHIVKPVTASSAWLAAQLIQWVGGNAEVSGRVIRHSGGFAIAVANGCSGIEAIILLTAAMVAFPASGLARLQGIVVGAAAILFINLFRIISLYYIGQHSRAWFDWAHLYAWDILIMIDGLIVFLIWVRRLPRRVHHAPA